jgi:hypothetical protein
MLAKINGRIGIYRRYKESLRQGKGRILSLRVLGSIAAAHN